MEFKAEAAYLRKRLTPCFSDDTWDFVISRALGHAYRAGAAREAEWKAYAKACYPYCQGPDWEASHPIIAELEEPTNGL